MNFKISDRLQDSWQTLDSKWEMPEKSVFHEQYVLPLIHSAEDAESRGAELKKLCQELSGTLSRLEAEFSEYR